MAYMQKLMQQNNIANGGIIGPDKSGGLDVLREIRDGKNYAQEYKTLEQELIRQGD